MKDIEAFKLRLKLIKLYYINGMCVICSIDSVKVKKFETFKFQFNAVVNTEKSSNPFL